MRRWWLVILLTLGVIIAYIDRTNLSIALAAAEFKNHFSLTDNDRGLLNSVFFWSYTAMQIPAGLIVDRFGVKRPLAIGFLLWCMIAASTAFAGVFWQLIAVRLCLGLAESTVYPGGLSWIRRHIPEHHRGLAIGVFNSGSKWGPAIAAPLAAWILSHYGWRQMFLLLGLGGLAWLVPWMLFAYEDPLPARRAVEPQSSFRVLFRTRVMWGTLIGTFCYNYFLFFSITWLPAYFVERRHLSLDSMGIYTGFSFAGTAVVAILAGAAADWIIRRGANPVNVRRWFTIAGLLVASTEVIGALSPSTDVAVSFALISMAGLGLASANYWALTPSLMPSVPGGRLAGIQNTSLNLAGIIAPILTGWLITVTGSYDAPMQFIWVVLMIGVGAYLSLARLPAPQ